MEADQLRAEGWRLVEIAGFSGTVGPYWRRGEGPGQEVGLLAESRHANSNLGIVHGGVLMSFADISLGFAVVDELGGSNLATLQLQLQFVSAGQVGELIVCRPELIRRSSNVVFMRGLITAGERIVASADGIWKILRPKGG